MARTLATDAGVTAGTTAVAEWPPKGDGKKYLALGQVEIDAKVFSKGDTIDDLDAKRAGELLAAGAIVLVPPPEDTATT